MKNVERKQEYGLPKIVYGFVRNVKMRKNDKEEIIITRIKAAEIFLILSSAKYKLNGKLKTLAEKYWAEIEDVLGLKPY